MNNNKIIIVVLVFALLCAFGVIGYFILFSQSSPIHISFGAPNEATVAPQITTQALASLTNLPDALPTYTDVPTFTPQPTYTNVPTFTLQPTYIPQATQVMEAMFTPNQPVFCRQGPSETVWWDPKEALKEGQTVKIIGKSSYEWGLWWYIQKSSGVKCWVYSELGMTSGNVAGVPEKSTPATPTPSYLDVYLRNDQGFQICSVWIETKNSGNWIELLNGNVIMPGGTLNYSATPGKYDIEIYDCFSNLVDSSYGFEISSNSTYFTTP